MRRKSSTKFLLTLSLCVVFLWLAANGCRGRTADPAPSPSAQINVSSRQIVNGNVVLNNISEQTVSLQNTGSKNLTIGQIAQANPLASPFSIVSDYCSGRTLQPAAACSFKAQFNPTSQGDFIDNFDIPSNASNENSVTVDVTGSGKALRVAINQVNTDGCPTGVLELIINVTDQNNAPLPGLALSDFQLIENSVLRSLESVTQVLTAVPVSVAMLLDYSGSMESQIPTLEAASINFIGDLNLDDEAAVIKFEVLPQLMQDFTDNKTALITAISTTPTQIGSGGTYLYDSLWYAVTKTAVRQKHKAIVVLSDGRDENALGEKDVSIKTPDEVIAYATANDVTIYAIGMGNVEGVVMNRLASETGGQYYYMTNIDQLNGVYQAIRDILFGYYSIKYVSTLHGGIPILLEIHVTSGGTSEGVGVWQAVGCP